MPVKVKDNGAKKLVKMSGRRASVKVGVLGGKDEAQHQGTDETVVEIATKHEFGIGVPQRSFIAGWVDDAGSEVKEGLERFAGRVERPEDLHQAMERFGLWVVGQMQLRISRGIAPPNSPVTIERKGSSTPLINTGQLRSSITHEVERG